MRMMLLVLAKTMQTVYSLEHPWMNMFSLQPTHQIRIRIMLFTVTITRRLWEYAFLPSRYAAILAGDCISLLFPLFHACIHLEGIFQLGPCVSDHFREFVLTKVYTCQHNRVPAECICWLTGLLFAINFLQYLHQCRCCETQKSALQCVLLFRKSGMKELDACTYIIALLPESRMENGKVKNLSHQHFFSAFFPFFLHTYSD